MSQLSEHELLKLQYEYQLCLASGKPYELPQEIIDDIERGFLF